MAGREHVILRPIQATALILGCFCLLAAGLAQLGRIAPAFDVLSHFAPLWLLGSLGCALCGAALARRAGGRRLIVVGALGLAAAAMLLAPEMLRPVGPRAPQVASRRIRLIQFNAWALNRDPGLVAEWMASQNPDVITVEELTPALRADLRRLGYHDERGMNRGVAIFSRAQPVPAPFVVPMDDWPVLPEFARATFRAPDGAGAYSLVAVHLHWPTQQDQWARALKLAEFLDLYEPDRLIVAGDFNLTPWSFALRRLDRRFDLERRDRALPTWPARFAVAGRQYQSPAIFPIDHVYAGAAWRTIAVRTGPSMGSDHYPLIVDLALSGGTDTAPGGCRRRCPPSR
jgi:endonuclease/exonuclease/phosphatase (EEP) superfamily protein YafD